MASGGRDGTRLRGLVVFATACAALAVAPSALAATITVTSNADSGAGSLRAAIGQANTTPGADSIVFSLAPQTPEIQPLSGLPVVTDPVTIDGAGTVTLDGALISAGNTPVGLEFGAGAGASVVRGLTITRFSDTGLILHDNPVLVAGNFIGTDAAGDTGLGNGGGVHAIAGAQIGGTTAADRNVISGNTAGLLLNGTGTIVQGNYIGTDPTGTTAVPNQQGIFLDPGTSIQIGGTAPGAGNVISGNTLFGIRLEVAGGNGSTGNTIYGNLIGTGADGATPLGNGQNVFVDQLNIDNNSIGGTGAGQGNTIAYSGNAGVFIGGSGRGDVIEGNNIFANQGLGIDLAPGGVTPNDATDADTGPNELQNFPVLTSATPLAGGSVEVTGSITPPPSTYGVDLYASAACDVSGNGEGARYLGTFFPSPPGSSTFDTGTAITGPVSAGEQITATVTDTALGNTSEFSACITAVSPTYTVTTGGSSGPGSLADAITQANAGGVPAIINFAIPGGGPALISTQTPLPAVAVPVTIDGTTEPGTPAGSMGIFLDNSTLHTPGDGLVLGAGSDGSVVRGLAIGGFTSSESAGLRVFSNSNTIAANYIGTDPTGSHNDSNSTGVIVQGSNNLVGGVSPAARNVISGNQTGIQVTDATATGNRIAGNYVGLDASGTLAIPGSGTGIILDGTSSGSKVGGTTPGSGNVVVSELTQTAVQVNQSTGNFVNGNLLGTDATGSVVLGDDIGVELDGGATGNTIGSVGPGANVMAGSADVGVLVISGGGNTIDGNFIGTDLNGTPLTTIPNSEGVRILNSGATGNTISNNRISSSVSYGIEADIGPNTISGNTIDRNGADGIGVLSGTGVRITGNAIDLNTGLGINLGSDGVTANDGQPDADTGPNNLQNFPDLTSALVSGGSVDVDFALHSLPSSAFTVEFFASPTCDPSANGEGAVYIGNASVNTDSNGAAVAQHASLTGAAAAAVTAGQSITATATAPDGSTSEFSTCVAASASPFVVTTTADSGAGSLRNAIDAANTNPGMDTISFAIPGAGLHTIQPATALPAITDPVVINGTTQPGFTNCPTGPMIELDGTHVAGDGLELTAGNSTVRGLIINRFTGPGRGIYIHGGGGNTVECNWIGTNAAGTAAAGNGVGIALASTGNLVGGASPAVRNVVSGNATLGIRVDDSTNTIQGNYIGTDAAGQTALGTGLGGNAIGIFVNGASNNTTIGGISTKQRNVISGNGAFGIVINGPGTKVQANYIGTNAAGTAAVPNVQSGVELSDSSTGATIGGTAPSAGNLISGNGGFGIFSNGAGSLSQGNTIQGNSIGTDASGTSAIGNANGGIGMVQASFGSRNEQVGGTGAGAGNVISGNGGPGISITGAGSTMNSIEGNSIDGNTGLGIDLGGDGVTPNDAQPDADTGPNDLQNFPTGLAGSVSGSTVHITGSLPSAPNTTYRVEFFASDSADPSGNGEGARFLGATSVTTDGNGAGPIDVMLTPEATATAGQWLSATATAPNGSTSEFSPSAQLADGGGTTITIPPQADTFVDAAQPTTNFGTADYSDTFGGTNTSCVLADGTSYTLMRFDLSSIPANATVTDVRLDTTTRAGFAQDGDPAHWALFVPDDSWSEAGPTGVTWNTRPSDGLTTVGDPTLPGGGGDVRQSALSLGAADVFRAGCSQDPDPAGSQTKTFPSTTDGFPRTVAQTEAGFKARVATERAGDGKLSLELWTPDCFSGCLQPGQAYWARYYTTRAADPAVRPKLIVTYTLPSPPTGSITLATAAGATNVTAGAAQVALANVPLSALIGTVFGVNSAPLGSIPVGSIPVGSIPVGSIPLGSIPLGSIGLTSNQTLLGSILLSTIPLLPPSSWAGVLAGTPLATQPLQSLTLAQVLANTTAAGRLNSVPVGSINLQNSPLGSIPVGSIPLGSIPVGSIPIPAASGEPSTDTTLQRWCAWLNGPPINCPRGGSLANTSLMSLALQGAPVGSIPLGSIPVGSIPLGSIPLGSIPLGSIPVGSITVDRVSIRLSPVGSIPLGSIPVGSIPVGSIPVGSIPVGSIDLQNSPVGSIPVGSIPVGSIVFNCSTNCPTTGLLRDHVAELKPGLTLEQLLRGTSAGAFDHITFADVIAFTTPAALHNYTIVNLINSALLAPGANITYADVLALLLTANTVSWETLDLSATPVQNFATGGSTLGYQADFHLNANGGPVGSPVTTKVQVTVPSGFLYQPGSSQLLVDNGSGFVPAGAQPGDPTIGTDGTLSWSVSPLVGTNYRITFTTRPSLTLGPSAASASVLPTGSPTATTPTPTNVTVGDTFEPNDTPATAKPIDANSFYLSYITSKSDVDYYTFPVPPAGTRVTFNLSHLPADYDLVVYGPAGAQQLRPPQPTTPPLDGAPLADTGFGTTHATDALAPQTLNDVALVSNLLPVFGVSTLRGTQDDAVAVISDGGAPGDVYTIQVSGFNGASSDRPYMLRAEATPPPAAPSCVPRTFTGSGNAALGLMTTAAGQVAAQVNTLFVVNDQQLAKTYGAAGTGVVTKLTSAATLSGLATAGFPAAVVHVDNNGAVQSAYTAWNACPSDPTKANAAVQAIGNVLDGVRTTFPNTEYEVLVGGDDLLPFGRLDDLTTVSTENGYASTFAATSALGGSLAASTFLSDDPYGTTEPIPFLNRQLDVPSLVTGRLVETPANINAQIDAFLGGATPGHVHPATALTTGYDFLSDGASAVSASLRTVAAGTANASAISNTWTKTTLLGTGALFLPSSGAAAPDIVSLNAHADHNHFEPASGTDLLSTSEVAAATQTFTGRLIFSMGCHAGLSVGDAFIPSNNLDWAQTFMQKGAADYAGNTGYGYGDTNTIAYSEDLNSRFASNAVAGAASPTGADLTIGEALTVAKQEYKGALGIVGVYDEKAMAELTLYGLPMYRIGGSGIPAPPGQQAQAQTLKTAAAAGAAAAAAPAAAPSVPPGSFPTEPATGLHVESFSADRTFPAATPAPPRGSFYTGSDGVLVEHFRPIQPKAIRPITIDSAHGALLTELTSNDVNPFDPVYARPTVDLSGNEPEVQFDDLAFPSKLQAVTTFRRLKTLKQQVVLAQGQFFATNGTDGAGTGTQRLFTHEAGNVFSSSSTDYAPPVFTTLDAQIVNGSALFAVDVTDRDGANAGTVKRVVVAYLETGGSVWHFIDLVQAAPGSSRWSGSGPISTAHLQYFVQAVDANGNVGVSTNKGLYYNEIPPPPPPSGGVAVAPTVNVPQSGWFNSGVNVQVTVDNAAPAAGVATLSIDGGPAVPYTSPVAVSGDGFHTATAQTADGSATTSFLIDTKPPVVTLTTPSVGGAVAQGSSATPVFSCSDAGIGIDTCASTGSAFTTSALGFHTFMVTGTDKLHNSASASATYAVIRISTPALNAAYTRTTAVTADFACGTTTCTATVTKPGGAVVNVTSGGPLPTDLTGTYTLAVTAADGAGNTATLTRAYTVNPLSLTGKIVFTHANHIWAINPDGTGLVQLTTGSGLDDQAAKSPDGTKIAFARRTTASGPSQLWLADADGRFAVQLTSSGDNTAPTWSSDGTKIAFSSNMTGSKGYDIWLLNPSTGVFTNLTNTDGDDLTPSWSPGRDSAIAFASNRKKSQFEIFTMTSSGGSQTQLTNDPGADVEPSYSPDGAKIAFSSNRATSGTTNGYEIYVMGAPNGNSQTRLTTLTGDDRAPAWASATKIVFSSAQFSGLATVAPTGGTSTKIPNTVSGDTNPG